MTFFLLIKVKPAPILSSFHIVKFCILFRIYYMTMSFNRCTFVNYSTSIKYLEFYQIKKKILMSSKLCNVKSVWYFFLLSC